MIFRKSIRWRIQAWHGLLLLAVTAAFGVTAWRLERENAVKRLDDDLKQRLGLLARALERGGPERHGRPPPGRGHPPRHETQAPSFNSPELAAPFDAAASGPFYYQVWHRSGTILSRSATAPEDIPPPAVSTMDPKVRERDGYREYYFFTPPGECLLAGRTLALLRREMREFAWRTAGIGGSLLAGGLAVGWWISSRALRPISAISAAAARIAEGNLKERIATGETESELGRLATLLDETFRRLDSAFEEQARFTSDAAHELRTPVSVILAQSQVALARERDAAFYRETIGASQRAARRMQSTIDSLLRLAVLDAAPDTAKLHAGDLAAVCREALPGLRVLAGEKGIAMADELRPASCRIDPQQIGEILTNLTDNAVKYSPTGSTVRVETGIRDGRAWLSVADDGPGIGTEHLPHLFERFYRTDRSRHSATGGTGLGLAICRRIARAHGGVLSVESEVGKGSVFRFELPAFTKDS